MDGRIVGLQQGRALGDGDGRLALFGDFAGDGLDLQRPHVGGGGIDHLARQGAGGGDAQGGGHIHPLRRDQLRPSGFGPGPVAVETIAAQGKGQGRRLGVRAADPLQMPGPRRQPRRQCPGRGRIEGVPDPEQRPGDTAVRPRQDQQLTGLAGKVMGPGPGFGRRPARAVQGTVLEDDLYRQTLGRAGDQRFGMKHGHQ